MTPITAQDIINDARSVYLNDPNGGLYSNSKLLPYVKRASDYLETSLEENNIVSKNKTESPIKVRVGATELSPLPADFIWPIELLERASGSLDPYIPMNQRPWEPQIALGDRLVYWTWREDKIKLTGALTEREVLLRYQRAFSIINVASDAVYGYAKQYLSSKTAALAHIFVSQNETLANLCDQEAEDNLESIINIQVKKTQSMPVRRRPYVPFR